MVLTFAIRPVTAIEVVTTINLGPESGSGLGPESVGVNPTTNLIYVANSDSGNVSVIDGKTNEVINTITVEDFSNGVGINPITNRIYIANGGSDNVSVIDGSTNQVIDTVTVGDSPSGIGVNSTTNRIYVANSVSNNVSVIDGSTNQVIDTISVGDHPHGSEINPTTNCIYVSNYNSRNISVIDGSTNQVIDTIPISNRETVCCGIADVGINTITNRIYVLDSNSLSVKVINGEDNSVIDIIRITDVSGFSGSRIEVNSSENRIYVSIKVGASCCNTANIRVIDGKTNKVIGKVAVGDNPSDIGINSTTNRIYVSDRSRHSVLVIDGETNENIDTITIQEFPGEIGINPIINHIYVANEISNNISVINGETNQVIDSITVGLEPQGIGINPATSSIYVANGGSNNVSVIDGSTNQVIDTITVGDSPSGVGVNSTTNRIYVVNIRSDNVSVIDGETNQLIDTITVGDFPFGLSVNPATNRIYVANGGSDNVSVIEGSTNQVINTIMVGDRPIGVGVNPMINRIYVANSSSSNNVSVIDGETNEVIGTIPVGDGLEGVSVNPATNRIYVTNSNSNNISVIDGSFNQVIHTITVGDFPVGVGVNPDTNLIYIANNRSSDVTVILDNANEPVAEFSASPTTGLAPLEVSFTDESTGNPTRWSWNFGDGKVSTEQNPVHTYKEDGMFTVGLMVSLNEEVPNWEIKNNLIKVLPSGTPTAAFEATPLGGTASIKVQFIDTSEGRPDSWFWDFGDGETSNLQNPVHRYKEPGVFDVKLNVKNLNGADSVEKPGFINIQSVGEPVTAFVAEPLTGFSPLTVQFANLSNGTINNLLWDFGDGSISSECDPIHTYTSPGTFTVTLTLNSSKDEVVETKTDLIEVLESGISDLSAAFQAASPRIVPPGTEVDFNGLSSGNIIAWLWDFGDGNTIGDRKPKHTYNNEGVFAVSLSVLNNDGKMDSLTKEAYIEIKEGSCKANFNMNIDEDEAFDELPCGGGSFLLDKVCFTDKSTGDIVSWFWDFGDGNFSAEQNPCHEYGKVGTFVVSLEITTSTGCVDFKEDIFVVEVKVLPPFDGFCNASFSIKPITSGCPQTVCFKDKSFGSFSPPTSWSWDFGDGSTIHKQNPCHTYLTGGTFTVRLDVHGCECGVFTSPMVKEIVIDCPLSVSPASARKSILFKDAIVTILDKDKIPASGVTVNASVIGKGRKLPIVKPSSATTDFKGEARFKFRFPVLSRGGEITFMTDDGLTATITER